ncbi:MAG: FKBP-type peptidyl-prolyl cis-trans isomerase [Bacteroidales bacterium]|nr:FKBP-type peptidyl-prolyl cis-trans isomerase [Bacteroidales bacterium]
MKKILLIASVALTCAAFMTACNSNKFKKAPNGLLYRFEVTNPDGEQPNVGDLLVGELVLRLENDTLFTNVGNPDRIFQVAENCMFQGDIQEGLLMMHKGDKAVFKIPADSIGNFMQPSQMPPTYQEGAGQFFYYEIALEDIVTKEELAQEQANFIEEMNQRKDSEPATLAQYIADNHITAKPTKSGLYIIVNKKGDGPKVAAGKKVSVNYTGRLLDGTLFDTSREADAKEADKVAPGRTYEPLSYVVGEQPMIKGWDEGIMGQPAGSDITLIMPSELAYGSRGAGKDILPYSPLVFNLTIESVE